MSQSLERVRAYIRCHYKGKAFKLVWINEDKQGVYFGLYGEFGGYHLSYHTDGRRHFKDHEGNVIHGPDQDSPIANISGLVLLTSQTAILRDVMFKSMALEYTPDHHTTTAIFLGPDLIQEHGYLDISPFIFPVRLEDSVVSTIYSDWKPNSTLLTANIFPLRNFPNHKVGVMIYYRSGNYPNTKRIEQEKTDE